MEGTMSVSEAGHKGGMATLEKHGIEHYQKIGKQGGNARSKMIQEEGISPELREKMAASGRKGGLTTKERHGREYFQSIGRKGGRPKKNGESL